MKPRAVVVGSGSAGSVLAARIADRYEVVVVEAGHRERPRGAEHGETEVAHPLTWALPAQLTSQRRWTATPGRAVGGSSIVNGGYFAPPTESDLARWHTAGGPAWNPERVLSQLSALESRLEVRPAPQSHPIAVAFAEASRDAGHAGGLLALGTTVTGGAPRSVGDVFLDVPAGPIEVRSDCRATRIEMKSGRATGVEVAAGDGTREVIAADEIILAAGGFGTARLLLASGIGPASQLSGAGIEVVADLPGVGAAFSDHPTVWVEWMPTPALARRDLAPDAQDGAFPIALCVGADGGPGDDVEILACVLPPEIGSGADSRGAVGAGRSASGRPAAASFGLIVGLQRPVARGSVVAASAHPLAPLRIAYGYLEAAQDRRALRSGVRLAARLLTSAAFSALVERLVDLDESTLRDDGLLDAWIAERLGSAAHTCGTAPMGPSDDPLAVVDGAGRVRAVAGLRVADTSLLPVVPVRGPAAAAMAVGAIIADQM